MIDDLIIVAVPGWILARDRHDGAPSWRRHHGPEAIDTVLRFPAPPDRRSRWPLRPISTAQEQRP